MNFPNRFAKLFIPTPVSGIRFTRGTRATGAMLVAVLGLLTASVQAQVVISNLPNTATGGSAVTATQWKAMVFTTGSLPTELSSITLGLNPNGTTAPSTQNVTLSLYSVTVTGTTPDFTYTPTSLLATTGLTAVTMSATKGQYSFSGLGGTALAASSTYALVISSDATGIKWGNNGTSSPTASDGFAYRNFAVTADSGANWLVAAAAFNALSISVSAVPEPSSYALLAGLTMLGMVATRRRRPVAA